MKRTYTALWILTTVLATTAQSNPAIGQNASPPSTPAGVPPTFSIADVHAPPQSKATYMNLSMVNHDRFVLDHATMIDMIPLAYNMDRNEVSADRPGSTTTATRSRRWSRAILSFRHQADAARPARRPL